jgi:hypothetical protein
MSEVKSIAQLLPEGLSEETVTQIAELVDTIINEEVNDRVKLLESKIKGFLRMEITAIKEHALKELQEENDIYRNAQLFESIKSLMSLEIGKTDEANGVSDIIKMSNQIEEENQVLIEELTSSTKQVQELERALKVLSKKNKALEEAASLLESEAIQLEEEVEQLKEQATLPFKTSEKAMIIADEMENTPVKKVSKVNNQFLTEGVMALMPKLNN